MSVIVFVEDWNGSFKKASFEATSYAKRWAKMLDTQVIAVTGNSTSYPELHAYGADHIIQTPLAKTGMGIAEQLGQLCTDAQGVVIAGTALGKQSDLHLPRCIWLAKHKYYFIAFKNKSYRSKTRFIFIKRD